ncbi:hypothetical protein [Sorangium sp. So ce1000]|uniref:hypothetical protein n=1 Tax=Sorangium sp. So ce1000 TaxID=3133325 RepID=UPI003F617FB7
MAATRLSTTFVANPGRARATIGTRIRSTPGIYARRAASSRSRRLDSSGDSGVFFSIQRRSARETVTVTSATTAYIV